MRTWLAGHGFDAERLGFAGRTAITACLAFVIAWAVGLEHPQWAAMTVWAASQPTRGQLLGKSFFRISGTIVGTVAGVLLVIAMNTHPALLVVGLALWVGACTFVGNLQRGLVSYGTVLAGYTAAMVALLDTAHPSLVLGLAGDRLATVLTGVLAAMLVGYLFAPPLSSKVLEGRVQTLLANLMDRLTKTRSESGVDADHDLLSEISAIEEGLDPHAAGSPRSRRAVHAVRSVLIAAVPLQLWRRSGAEKQLEQDACVELAAAAEHFRNGDLPAARNALDLAATYVPQRAVLHENLAHLGSALDGWQRSLRDGETNSAPPKSLSLPVVLHRDWAGAREAMIRASGCLLFFGTIWLVTGWSAATFMLLGLSVMLSLFSTMENPARMMRFVFLGQVYGVIGALICRWLVWPMASTELQMILFTLPFILVGPLLVSHRRTNAASFDYNMVMLLMLQPHWPMTGSFGASIAEGLAVISAPLAAMVAFNYVYPPTLWRQLSSLVSALLHDIADLAGDAEAVHRRSIWQARLYHRTLRLVRLSERSKQANLKALDAGLAFLDIGRAAMRSHELLESAGTSVSEQRALKAVLARIEQIEAKPLQAQNALVALARRLNDEDAGLLKNAALGITALMPYLTPSALQN